jgi:hypothetical protein
MKKEDFKVGSWYRPTAYNGDYIYQFLRWVDDWNMVATYIHTKNNIINKESNVSNSDFWATDTKEIDDFESIRKHVPLELWPIEPKPINNYQIY